LKLIHPGLKTIDHIILSHPHRDHVELLPDLFDAYEVKHVWDSGRANPICGYRMFLTKIAAEPTATYHDAIGNFGTHSTPFEAQSCYGRDLIKETINITRGSRISEEPVELGQGARMRFLYADATPHPSINDNSLVVSLELGSARILFMGDAEAGGRANPTNTPKPDSVEGTLLTCCAAELRADILFVGHHGSMTSSRDKLLDAVGAKTFIVSSGPTKYATVTLPDKAVIDDLQLRGEVFRTDLDDQMCSTNAHKVGPDNDGKAGGCENVVITVNNDGSFSTAYSIQSD
jgi:competence protein ComEC